MSDILKIFLKLGQEDTNEEVVLKNVNFLGNPTSKGLDESCGIMVNYIYTSGWLARIRRSLKRFGKMEVT